MKSSISFLKSLVVLALVFWLVPALALTAATYYVATNGNDSNPGTLASPWRTVQKAASTMVAGDTTYLRAGTYSESNITFAHSGNAGNPITLKNYPGEAPTIDGGFTSGTADTPVFRIDGPSYLTFDGLEVTRGSANNFKIGENGPDSHDITIQNCNVHNHVAIPDNNAEIYLGTSPNNILIQNNYIHDYQGSGMSSSDALIMYYPQKVTILNNEMYNLMTGFHIKFASTSDGPVTVQNNLIHDMANGQPHGINLGAGYHVTVTNNVIYNVSSPGKGFALYENSGSCSTLITSNNTFTHNTVVNTFIGIEEDQDSGCQGAYQNTFRDNIIYGFTDSNRRGVSVWHYTATDGSQTTFEHNLVYSSSLAQPFQVYTNYYTMSTLPASILGNTATNTQLAPVFVNASASNYALTSSSPGHLAASDGTDMGANTALVGVNAGSTGAPQIPSGVKVQ